MSVTSNTDCAGAIIRAVGSASNIKSLTHCATRLRFELVDSAKVDQAALDAIPEVLGGVPQSGNRYQVIIGGAVQSVFNQITNHPDYRGAGALSDADIKAQARAKAKGKFHAVDAFFEYLSDSFRPILGVLLGASLIIAFAAVMDALGYVDFRSPDKAASWVFVDAMWRSVFYFLPIMIAYNAAKKLNIDPWVGGAAMAALMTPEFMKLSDAKQFTELVCSKNAVLGTDACTAKIFGLPMQLNDYGGNVFVPLIMVAILAVFYKLLKKIFPSNVQMVFVPFFSLLIIIPLTAFLIGPLGIWLGNGLGAGLAWMNTHAPFVFAIFIPMLYPFLVPLGLHWPLNALMLINIDTLGYDFIQGPMGAWNFACFGATAGVLFLSIRDKDVTMRQTAIGALAAGLFGGISEPSLYGIHLRFKRIYPRMLVGCFAGGLTIALLSLPYHGVKTNAFVFTSLLTIPVFKPMWVYGVSIAVAFFTAMALIVISGYRDKEEAAAAANGAGSVPPASQGAQSTVSTVPSKANDGSPDAEPTNVVLAPVSGDVIPVSDVADPVFSTKVLGDGVGITPTGSQILAPISGSLVSVTGTGHAFGLKSDDGIEVLVHVGIDTVKLNGKGFEILVTQGNRIVAGEPLCNVDFGLIAAEGFDTTTIVTVTNSASLTSVTPLPATNVAVGAPVIDIQR
ncbi:glucose PTS transporter subunit IIA [Trueperella sp. LYQ141]|uniref:glucose PTS transporter subunit IIA n=1 Tax=Trueperella sp. LYQ141 TaxID=3391058 RepID=UPI003983C39A